MVICLLLACTWHCWRTTMSNMQIHLQIKRKKKTKGIWVLLHISMSISGAWSSTKCNKESHQMHQCHAGTVPWLASLPQQDCQQEPLEKLFPKHHKVTFTEFWLTKCRKLLWVQPTSTLLSTNLLIIFLISHNFYQNQDQCFYYFLQLILAICLT